jgi:hypothetical protein
MAMTLTRSLSIGVLAAVLTSGACAPIKVNSFVDQRADFSLYRTYAWADDTPRATGDPRLDNNPFFHERLQSDADNGLAARGFERARSGSPDLMLHYHASFTQEIDVARLDREYEYDTSQDGGVPSVYEAGSVVLDFVDTRSNRLVWRGWAKGSMDGAINDQAYMEQRLDDVVARVVATVPHR